MYAMHLPMDRIIKVDDFFTSFILFLVTRVWSVMKEHPSGHPGLLSSSERIEEKFTWRQIQGAVLDVNSLQRLEEKRDIFYLLSYVLHNAKPVGHQVYFW